MKKQEHEEIEWLQFDHLSQFPNLTHAIFLRHGGVSEGPYESLNLSAAVGDDLDNVARNMERVKALMQIDKMVISKQPHGIVIAEVTPDTPLELKECDGFCTSHKEVGMMVRHADCQAAIFYDPVRHVVANVHSGWRGNVQNIYAEAVSRMQVLYGSQPADLFVGIGPSLGPDASEFVNYKEEWPEEFWQFQFKPNFFDLWAIAEYQLKNAGILSDHIEIIRISTYSHSEDYFSFRRNKVTGRHGTVVVLR